MSEINNWLSSASKDLNIRHQPSKLYKDMFQGDQNGIALDVRDGRAPHYKMFDPHGVFTMSLDQTRQTVSFHHVYNMGGPKGLMTGIVHHALNHFKSRGYKNVFVDGDDSFGYWDQKILPKHRDMNWSASSPFGDMKGPLWKHVAESIVGEAPLKLGHREHDYLFGRCASFAVALRNHIGGDIHTLWQGNNVLHAYLKSGGRSYDVKGLRSTGQMAMGITGSLDGWTVKGPHTDEELSDLNLKKVRPEHVAQATTFIRSHLNRYKHQESIDEKDITSAKIYPDEATANWLRNRPGELPTNMESEHNHNVFDQDGEHVAQITLKSFNKWDKSAMMDVHAMAKRTDWRGHTWSVPTITPTHTTTPDITRRAIKYIADKYPGLKYVRGERRTGTSAKFHGSKEWAEFDLDMARKRRSESIPEACFETLQSAAGRDPYELLESLSKRL